VIHELYSTKSPKKDLIKNWAEHLEALQQLGEFKDEVSTISNHIKKELLKMGLPDAVHYVHEVLPFKYKLVTNLGKESDGLDERGSSTLNSSDVDYEKENQEFLSLIDETIEFLEKVVKPKLQKSSFCSLLDQELLKEFYLVHSNAIDLGKNIFNDKRKDMVQTQCLLVERAMHCTPTFAAGEYMRRIKDIFEFTGKQVVKILRGQATELHPLYDPKNKEEAMKIGMHGMRCTECGSWRVGYIYVDKVEIHSKKMCHCFKCGFDFEPITENITKALEK